MKSERYASLDGLRGLAALWVVCYHVWNRFFPGMSTQSVPRSCFQERSWDYFLTFPTIQFGYLGVFLFFVLSGFCIHLPQARRTQSVPFCFNDLAFLKRRFCRLYPAYFASLLLTSAALAVFPILAWASSGRRFDIVEAFGAVPFLQNALFAQLIWPDALQFNGVYWTLLYEAQFYLLYPVMLRAARACGFRSMLLLLLACEVYFAFRPLTIGGLFITRYYEWFLGMFAAEMIVCGGFPLHRALNLTAGAACAAIGAFACFNEAIFPLRDALFTTAFFFLLSETMRRSTAGPTRLKALAELKPLVGLGFISYSLYLIHVPIIDVTWNAFRLLGRYFPLYSEHLQSLSIIAIPLSLSAAYVSYRLFERPFLATKEKRPSATPARP